MFFKSFSKADSKLQLFRCSLFPKWKGEKQFQPANQNTKENEKDIKFHLYRHEKNVRYKAEFNVSTSVSYKLSYHLKRYFII